MPGLSKDPVKRQRQLDALAAERRAQAERLLASPGSAPAQPGHEPTSPGIPVATYDDDPEPEEPPHGRQADEPEPEPEPGPPGDELADDGADPADAPAERARGGGFLGALREGLSI